VNEVAIVSTDNAPILSVPTTPVDEARAKQAVEDATKVLAGFLNTQFVDTRHRFSGKAIERLVTPAVGELLDDKSRRGLGVLPLDVDRTVTGDAAVRKAVVVMDADRPLTVTLDFVAQVTATLTDGTETAVVQRGQVVLVPIEDGWRARAVDVSIEAPGVAA
jgi:hypothetical protein